MTAEQAAAALKEMDDKLGQTIAKVQQLENDVEIIKKAIEKEINEMKDEIKKEIERMKQTIDLGIGAVTADMNSKLEVMSQSMWKMIKEEVVEKIKGVKLLYHETTFMQDRSVRANETNHSTTIDAANIAKLSSARNLLIGHFSQRYQDKDLLLKEVKSIFNKSFIASEGLIINFSDL